MTNGFSELFNVFNNIGRKISEIIDNETFKKTLTTLNEIVIKSKDSSHIEELARYGWTMNHVISRYTTTEDYESLNSAILIELKDKNSFGSYKVMLESIMEDSTENKMLYKDLIESISNHNYRVCFPSLAVLIENNLRNLTNQWDSKSYGVKKYIKKGYELNKDMTLLYSLSLFLDTFFKYKKFDDFRNESDYNILFNRNLSQHGVYDMDKVNKDEIFKLVNVLFTIHQIKIELEYGESD